MRAATVFAQISDRAWYADNWQSLWFWREGWMTLLYGVGFMSIAFLWRPTKNNARYGLEELPGDVQAADAYDMEMAQQGGARKRASNVHGEIMFEVGSDGGGSLVSSSTSPQAPETTAVVEPSHVFSLDDDDHNTSQSGGLKSTDPKLL